jgi:hypothetical protein
MSLWALCFQRAQWSQPCLLRLWTSRRHDLFFPSYSAADTCLCLNVILTYKYPLILTLSLFHQHPRRFSNPKYRACTPCARDLSSLKTRIQTRHLSEILERWYHDLLFQNHTATTYARLQSSTADIKPPSPHLSLLHFSTSPCSSLKLSFG